MPTTDQRVMWVITKTNNRTAPDDGLIFLNKKSGYTRLQGGEEYSYFISDIKMGFFLQKNKCFISHH
jgi:hypothetical protein